VKKKEKRASAGVEGVTQETPGEMMCDFTQEDVEMAARDVEIQRRKRRKRAHQDANKVRLMLRQRLTLVSFWDFLDFE
jgi:hypothetical protein